MSYCCCVRLRTVLAAQPQNRYRREAQTTPTIKKRLQQQPYMMHGHTIDRYLTRASSSSWLSCLHASSSLTMRGGSTTWLPSSSSSTPPTSADISRFAERWHPTPPLAAGTPLRLRPPYVSVLSMVSRLRLRSQERTLWGPSAVLVSDASFGRGGAARHNLFRFPNRHGVLIG